MTMRKFLPLLAAATAAAALATGCVTNGAITTLDLTDTNGETLQSVSEWDPGESHTYSMPTLPDGCEVNIVSSDPSLLSAELSEGTLTLTAENTGKAILTVEVALDGNTFSKSYEMQISDRQLQVGVTLIDSRTIADPSSLEDSFRPAQPSLGGAVFADNFLELQVGNQATLQFTGFDATGGEPVPVQSAVTVRTASEETGFDGTYYLSGDRVVLQCPRAGQYTLELLAVCDGYPDTPVTLTISVSEPNQTLSLSAKGFDPYAPVIEVGGSVTIDVETLSEESTLAVTADGTVATAAVTENGRVTITAVTEGTGSVTITATAPGYADTSLTIPVESVPELIPLTILGDRLERNNVVQLAVGETVELTVLNPDEGTLTRQIADVEIVEAVQKSNKLELTGLSAGETTITLTCERGGYTTNEKVLTVRVTEE